MRLVHHRVVDTSVVFPHRLGPPYKRALKTIASEILQLIIQEDSESYYSKKKFLFYGEIISSFQHDLISISAIF